ncbi:MAG: hypothetical protein FH753_09420 [Firmicutes bacterium]|nr:hypothetical protein [Bacillota bacterium]
MYTMKLKRMDMISGLYEVAIYSIGNYNHQRKNFFDKAVPDIIVNQNINYFKTKPVDKDREQRSLELTITS